MITTKTSNKLRYCADWLFFIFIFGALFFLSREQIFTNGKLFVAGDIHEHLLYIKALASDPSKIRTFLEPGFALVTIFLAKIFSIDFNLAAPIALSTFFTAFVFVLFKIFKKELKLDDYRSIAMCLVAILVTPIYIPFISHTFYLLFGSPNVWHNNTVLMVKLFALYITYLTITKIEKTEYDSMFYFLSGSLVVSSLFKPSYVEVFIPALFCYTIFLSYKNQNLKQLRYALLLVAPTVILLGWQFWAWQLSKEGFYAISFPNLPKSHLIFTFFGVTNHYTQRPFFGSGPLVGFLRATAFPLALAAVLNKKMQPHLVFSWVMLIIAYLQFSFIAESVPLLASGNFTWGYVLALQLVFIFSIIDFKKWLQCSFEISNKYILGQAICLLGLLSWHFISGAFYFYKVFSGGSYW